MKRINKVLELATVYKTWHDELKADNHPKYNSSSNPHYYSILANLIHVQNGLCAYTEVSICDPEIVSPEKWKDGIFERVETFGQLDHYNPNLKKKNGWLWDNFFIIHTDINTKVKRNNVATILKPDLPDFDVRNYLKYNIENHCFIVKAELPPKQQNIIIDDIDFLGLNYNSIVYMRRMYLTPILKDIQYGALTPELAKSKLYHFFTSYEMAVEQVLKL